MVDYVKLKLSKYDRFKSDYSLVKEEFRYVRKEKEELQKQVEVMKKTLLEKCCNYYTLKRNGFDQIEDLDDYSSPLCGEVVTLMNCGITFEEMWTFLKNEWEEIKKEELENE